MYDTYLDTINGIRMMDGCSPDQKEAIPDPLSLCRYFLHTGRSIAVSPVAKGSIIFNKGAAELESSFVLQLPFVLFYLIISSAGLSFINPIKNPSI